MFSESFVNSKQKSNVGSMFAHKYKFAEFDPLSQYNRDVSKQDRTLINNMMEPL